MAAQTTAAGVIFVKKLLIVAGLVLVAAALFFAVTAATAPAPLRVLFIGNSYTYFNRMPQLLEQIAKSKDVDIRAEMSVEGSATLKGLWERGPARYAIRQTHFDYVFIQPQSSEIPRNPRRDADVREEVRRAHSRDGCAANPLRAVASPASSLLRNSGFVSPIEGSPRPFACAWHPSTPAWQAATWDGARLSSADNTHPNLAGSYLAACVFFAMIVDRDPAGATQTFALPSDTPGTREPISDDIALALQRAAWDAVRKEPLAKR